MSASNVENEDFKQHIKVYVMVFVTLGVLTLVTVAVSYLRLPTAAAITVAMIVATVKAGLVAGYFMHLLSEEKEILWLLALCATLFVTLRLVPLATMVGIAPLWPL